MSEILFPFQIKDDTATARRRRRGVFIYTLRKPTTTPTKVALDLETELPPFSLPFCIILNAQRQKESQENELCFRLPDAEFYKATGQECQGVIVEKDIAKYFKCFKMPS
jgi:hypothetical protein